MADAADVADVAATTVVAKFAEAAPGSAAHAACQAEIIAAVANGIVTIQNLVRLLGGLLTSTEEKRRASGTGLLSLVLQRVPGCTGTADSVHHLITFYCDRLQDVTAIVEVLDGLLALLQCEHNVTGKDAVAVAQAMFKELAVQSLSQPMRHKVYSVQSELLSRFGPDLLDIDSEFVGGVVAAVDGEKDPRNLLLVFSMVPILTATLDSARDELAEELFDVVAVYFPITFEAPTNDKFGVTGEQLRDALSAAFCATSAFAELAIPMLCEKLLESVDRSLKLQCLLYLQSCLQAYDQAAITEHFNSTWTSLVEDCGNIDDAVADAAVGTGSLLLEMVAVGSEDGQPMHPHLQTAAAMALTRCTAILKEVASGSLHRTRWTGRVLRAVLAASSTLCSAVAAKLVPELVSVHADIAGVSDVPFEKQQRVIAAVHLIRVISDASHAYSDGSWAHPLTGAKTAVIAMLEQSSGGESAMASWLLTVDELSHVVDIISKSVVDGGEGAEYEVDSFSKVCVNTLVLNSRLYPTAVLAKAVEPLFAQVQAQIHPAKLHVLSTFAINTPAHFGWVFPQLLAMADTIFKSGGSAATDKDGAVCAVMACADGILKTIEISGPADGRVDCLVECGLKMFEFTISCYTGPEAPQTDAHAAAARTLRCITATCPADSQQRLVSTAVDRLADSPESSTLLAATAVLTAYEPTVLVPRVAEVCAALYSACENSTGESTDECEAAGQCLGSMFNKSTVQKNGELASAQEKIVGQLVKAATAEDVDPDTRVRNTTCLVWVIKGLAMCGSLRVTTLLQALCSVISAPTTDTRAAATAARGFGIILRDTEVLSRGCHAVVRMLFRQKVFLTALPQLLAVRERASAASQVHDHVVLAILEMCQCVPASVILPEVDKLMPLITGAFKSEMQELVTVAIRTTSTLVVQSPAAVMASSVSVASALLLATTFTPCMAVRRDACLCLRQFAENLPYPQMFPLKEKIIREIAPALDDSKRLVRKEASACRNAWYKLKA